MIKEAYCSSEMNKLLQGKGAMKDMDWKKSINGEWKITHQMAMDWQESNGYKKEADEIRELIEYIRNTRSDRFCSSNLMSELYSFDFVPHDAKPGHKHMIRKLNKIGIATLEEFRLERNKP